MADPQLHQWLDYGGPCHDGPGCCPDPDPADMIPEGDTDA